MVVHVAGYQGAEGVPHQPDRDPGVPTVHLGDRRPHVVLFGYAASMAALRIACPAEIEPYGAGAKGPGGAPCGLDDVVAAVTPVERVRMRHHDTGDGPGVIDDVGGEVHTIGRGQGHGFAVHRPHGTVPRVPPSDDKLAIKMLNDRLLVRMPDKEGERRSMGGILIPATAQLSKRLVWAEVVALGQNVRSAEVGDQVLFSPEDRYEVEVQGVDYIMLRERDLHAVAASRIDGHTGLYL